MGMTDQKFCKVTIHRSDSHRPWEHASARSTIAYKQLTPDGKPSRQELARWTATGDAALDGLDMPTRRRAHTTTATMGMEPLQRSSRGMNPMSRLTMRFEQEPAEKEEGASAEINTLDNELRNDSFLAVDTDAVDPVRQTFDEESKMFVPGTPPIPTGITVDMLPTADFTPEIPSAFKRALEMGSDDVYSSTDNSSAASSPRDSRIRISSPGKESSIFGDSRVHFPAADNDSTLFDSRIRLSSPKPQDDSLFSSRVRFSSPRKDAPMYNDDMHMYGEESFADELPTPIMSSSVSTVNDSGDFTQDYHDIPTPKPESPIQQQPLDEPVALIPITVAPVASYEEIRLSEPAPELKADDLQAQQPQQKLLVEEEPEAISSFVEVDSDNEDELEEEEGGFDVCDNFDAILGEPLPNRGSRWRFSLSQRKSNVRQKRGMSSPPVMVGVPPPTLARHTSVPVRTPPLQTGESIRPKPIVHAPAGNPLYHGQTLHLNFKSTDGHTVQVSTKQRHSKSSVFSKLIECFSMDNDAVAEADDAFRIIAHTSDGDIRGGDRISLARGDGSVLRIQKMSRKLAFSPKIDMKAKFVVCGVPEGTVVTDTTKFYLQSVYDRTKTIGFLKDRRHPGAGCLVMYAYRTTDDKSEPIQFFKRAEPPSFGQMHAVQQGHALQTSPLMGGFM